MRLRNIVVFLSQFLKIALFFGYLYFVYDVNEIMKENISTLERATVICLSIYGTYELLNRIVDYVLIRSSEKTE